MVRKTTTIKILMNIFRPTGGAAEILGIDSRKIDARALASIGYVSENQELPLWMTVAGFLGYLRPFYPTWDRKLEDELIQRFELPPLSLPAVFSIHRVWSPKTDVPD
jgi:ABC-2 type transport system ATP-binding protein